MEQERSDRLWLSEKYAPQVHKALPPEMRTAGWLVRDGEDGKLEFKFDLDVTDPLLVRRMYNNILVTEEASFPELKGASKARREAISADVIADNGIAKLKVAFKERQQSIPATKRQISGLWYDFNAVVDGMKPDSLLGSMMAIHPDKWDIPSLALVLIQAWKGRYSENADLQKQAKAYSKEILACAEIYISYQKRLCSIRERYTTPFHYFAPIGDYSRAIEVAQKKLQSKLRGIESEIGGLLNSKRKIKKRPGHPRPNHIRREEIMQQIHVVGQGPLLIEGAELKLRQEMQHQFRRALKMTTPKSRKPKDK